MPKKIGYIEKDGVVYVSVKDVFEYLREVEVIVSDKSEGEYLWDFEQDIIKRMYACYRSGERSNSDVPWIIDGEFYCHWLRFVYSDFARAIKVMRNEQEVKRLAMLIDLHDFARSKMFVKRKFALK